MSPYHYFDCTGLGQIHRNSKHHRFSPPKILRAAGGDGLASASRSSPPIFGRGTRRMAVHGPIQCASSPASDFPRPGTDVISRRFVIDRAGIFSISARCSEPRAARPGHRRAAPSQQALQDDRGTMYGGAVNRCGRHFRAWYKGPAHVVH